MMIAVRYSILCALLAGLAASQDGNETAPGPKSYDGYQLLEILPKTSEEVQWVRNIGEATGEELDVWMETGRLTATGVASDASAALIRPTQLLVSAEQKAKVETYLQKHSIKSSVKIEDFGQIVRDDVLAFLRPEGVAADAGPHFNLNEYHSYDEIIDYLIFVANEHEELVQLGSIGNSYEGRNLTYLKIGYPNKSEKSKNALFIDAGIHAREWITPATALHFIHELVTNEKHKPLLESIDIYVLPSLNPDGYEYSRKVDRMWRKSRTGPRGSRHCFGVDLNRNFEYYWSYSGVSNNPCSEIYCGPSELSESESRALTQFLQDNNNFIKGYITLHSYGNLLIHPWGHILNSFPDDIDDVRQAGIAVAKAIVAAGGPEFIVGTSPDILYEVAGSSQDFAKSIGIKYTYTMELTNAPSGFVYPKQEIQHVAYQIIPGLLVFADYVQREKSN